MRAIRNVSIILLLAAPVAFAPGGGNAADAILTALTLVFLATLPLAARQLFLQNRLSYDGLPDEQRGVLLGSVGVLVLMVAGTDEMLGGGGAGALLWVTLVGVAILAIAAVWTRASAY